jgi:hypothetical protein
LAWALLDLLHSTVLLDADNFGAVNPFDLGSGSQKDYLHRTLAHCIRFHAEHGYRNFVVPGVFAGAADYAGLIGRLAPLAFRTFRFRLDAAPEQLEARIRSRDGVDRDWELVRFASLQEKFRREWRDPEEIVVDTSSRPPSEVAYMIMKRLFQAKLTEG